MCINPSDRALLYVLRRKHAQMVETNNRIRREHAPLTHGYGVAAMLEVLDKIRKLEGR